VNCVVSHPCSIGRVRLILRHHSNIYFGRFFVAILSKFGFLSVSQVYRSVLAHLSLCGWACNAFKPLRLAYFIRGDDSNVIISFLCVIFVN